MGLGCIMKRITWKQSQFRQYTCPAWYYTLLKRRKNILSLSLSLSLSFSLTLSPLSLSLSISLDMATVAVLVIGICILILASWIPSVYLL